MCGDPFGGGCVIDAVIIEIPLKLGDLAADSVATTGIQLHALAYFAHERPLQDGRGGI